MSYDKMNDFIETVYNVYIITHNKSNLNNDKRQKCISFLILGYISTLACEYQIDLKQIKEQSPINLIPFFEYIHCKNIELFEFDKIQLEDVDTNKSADIEKFILSHIYYITQK